MPTLSEDSIDFVPAMPIPVQVVTDDVATSNSLAESSSEPHSEQKKTSSVTNPPPAYGRWRGSVRADPDLLHWQAQPSPDHESISDLPSPTYQEVDVNPQVPVTCPPSYVTRDSPARRREMSEARADLARAHAAEPEMVEVRGVEGAL